ncbi:MAG: fibrobacter succinogenes major paralogous domain-containing protein, partial [Bacteroidales bacterium]|nr:fibrobacter succinogenes major paralogous domain-containing protein [Bacteroidales bacterium]
NLNVGTMISGTVEMTNNGVIEKYCFDNNTANCDIYGGLYQWDEMMQYTNISGVQGICPAGWHLPTNGEWTILTDHLGGTNVAGGKMKETGAAHWHYPNAGATNESGFTALPGGYRDTDDGSFEFLTHYASFWSSSQDEYVASSAWYRGLGSNYASVLHSISDKQQGYSVRCVKDEN